jgi:hypothetical protein
VKRRRQSEEYPFSKLSTKATLSKGIVSLHDNKRVPSYAYKQKKQHITCYILEANSNFKSIWNVGQDQKKKKLKVHS